MRSCRSKRSSRARTTRLIGPFGDGAELVRLTRLRLVDDEPVGLHRTLLERATATRAGVTAQSMRAPGASLYALLEAAGVHVVGADEHLQAVPASSQDAKRLRVKTGAPLMRVIRVTAGTDDHPVEVTDARYIGERFDYSVSLTRPERHHEAGPEQSTTGRSA